MQTILVTGGAGFIGSHVCERLIAQGKIVVCVDNLNDYYDPTIKRQNIIGLKDNPSFHFEKIDILDDQELDRIFSEYTIDAIIHLAARAGVRPSLENPLLYANVNILGTINLLERAHRHGVKKIVAASSSSIYGSNTKIPFAEHDETISQVSQYAASKKAMEAYCQTYYNLYKIPTVCLRFFTVYGPRGRPDMATYKFISKIENGESIEMFGDGTSKRDYTFVHDIVDGIIAALDADITFEIINLGNNTPVMLKDFIATIENALGKQANIIEKPEQQGDVKMTYADLTRAKEILGYEPRTNLAEGIKKTVEWYRGQSI